MIIWKGFGAKRFATEIGQQLYSMLLQPVFAQVDKLRLMVVPDGPAQLPPIRFPERSKRSSPT